MFAKRHDAVSMLPALALLAGPAACADSPEAEGEANTTPAADAGPDTASPGAAVNAQIEAEGNGPAADVRATLSNWNE